MKLLHGLDFETTGLDPKKDFVVEVGSVIWDMDLHVPVAMDNFFVDWGVPISEEITKINGVQQYFVNEYGLEPAAALARLRASEARCDANVAHNGINFDKEFYRVWNQKFIGDTKETDKLWIDTQQDIDFPDSITTRKLTYLAAEHGFLNPFAHRAVFDVLTMMVILDKYPLEPIIYSAKQPTVLVQALVSYDNRDQAKEKRFYWDGEKKMWLRQVKQHKIEGENYPFKWRIVG